MAGLEFELATLGSTVKCTSDCAEDPSNTHIDIPKTCLYNFGPLKPQFYIVKLGFIEVYIIFLILLKNIDCGYSLEPPNNLYFEQKYEKY